MFKEEKRVSLTWLRGLGQVEMKWGGWAQGPSTKVSFKQGCDVVPLAFTNFPVVAVGQKFYQGQKWRQQGGKAVERPERDSAEVGRSHQLGLGRLGLSCLWVSGGAWNLE